MFSPLPITRPAKRDWRETVRRAVDLAVAFATLEDALEPRGHDDVGGAHLHRRPLRAPSRVRRPGAGTPRPQLCVTPLPARMPEARPRRRHARTPSVR